MWSRKMHKIQLSWDLLKLRWVQCLLRPVLSGSNKTNTILCHPPPKLDPHTPCGSSDKTCWMFGSHQGHVLPAESRFCTSWYKNFIYLFDLMWNNLVKICPHKQQNPKRNKIFLWKKMHDLIHHAGKKICVQVTLSPQTGRFTSLNNSFDFYLWG